MTMGTCFTCDHWAISGRCLCDGTSGGGYNPHYYDGDILSADDSCEFWKKSLAIEEQERQERERQERKVVINIFCAIPDAIFAFKEYKEFNKK